MSDFTDEQKRWLEGFTSGLAVRKVGPAPAPSGPDALQIGAQDRLVAAGGKLVLMHRFEPEAALALIERERVTVTGGVPAIMLALLEHPRLGEFDLSSLKLATYGGAPPPAEEREKEIPAG